MMDKIKQLEGLRGIAALVVFNNHLLQFCFQKQLTTAYVFFYTWEAPAPIRWFCTELFHFFHDGYIAVWIFWLMSAYVLSLGLFRTQPHLQQNKIITSFLKRYPRLLIPVLASVLFALVLLWSGLIFNQQVSNVPFQHEENLWLQQFFPKIYSVGEMIDYTFYQVFINAWIDNPINPVLWTIRNEFLGSLFIFALFGIVRRHPKRYLVFLALTVAIFFNEAYWMLAFLFGYIICDYRHSNPESKIRLAIIQLKTGLFRFPVVPILLFLILLTFSRELGTWLKLPDDLRVFAISGYIVLLGLFHPGFVRFFTLRFNLWLGKVSFSFYLLHIPILCSFGSYLLFTFGSSYKVLIGLVSLGVSLGLAYVFYRYIDNSAIRWSNRFSQWFITNPKSKANA